MGPLLFLGLALLVGLAIWHQVMQQQKRRQVLQAWASKRGWSFWSGRDRRFEKRFAGFDCLRRGSGRFAEIVVEGRRGDRRGVAFDYHYQTSDGKNTHTHRFSGVVLDSGLRLDPLGIRCETVFDRVGSFFGMRDIDFELAEFNRAFHVRSPNRRWATDVIQQDTMEFLLTAPRFQTQFAGRFVMVWRDRRLEPAQFEQAFALAEGLLERMPPSLVLERRIGAK